MECSIKAKRIDQSMKNYKRAQIFLYNLTLYSLTSFIVFFFFSYQISFLLSNLSFSLPTMNINYLVSLDAKCLFIVANLIIFILIRESKLAPSPNLVSDIYDEYVARSQKTSTRIKVNTDFVVAKEKEEEKRDEIIVKNVYDEKKKKEMRVCNSMHYSKQEKKGLRMSKSEVWGESEIKKMEKGEEKRDGIIVKNVYDEKKKKEMRVSNSMHYSKQEKKGLRMSRSEVWGESEIKKMEKNSKGVKESQVYIPKEELNKRIEAFIARVNKQRLLEAKLVDHSRG